MRRYPSSRDLAYSFGPGPWTPAIKFLIITNVVMYVVRLFVGPDIDSYFGLVPSAIFHQFYIWQPFTYMFLHGSPGHILFNMLALWMFGTEFERMWGTPAFLRYYFAVGVAAGLSTVLVSLLPFAMTARIFDTPTIGASGAIYGLLLAYGLTFPNRVIYMIFIPVLAKYFVMIMGAISLLSAIGDSGGATAHITHLGGLLAGYLLLRAPRFSPANEVRYRYVRWKMEKARKRFGVHTGGKRDDWDKRIH
jgi:membrane associated rhomboid family serine protease